MQGGELWVVVVYCCNISKNVYTAELLVLKGKNMQLLGRQVSKNSFFFPSEFVWCGGGDNSALHRTTGSMLLTVHPFQQLCEE